VSALNRKVIHAVAGIIVNAQREILIAQRLPHQYAAGQWEFPGGKIELGETPQAALQRELHEELGIDVSAARRWLTIQHAYPEYDVVLETWLVTDYVGVPYSKEQQPICWVLPHQFSHYPFLEGNREILEKLQNVVI